MYIRHRTPITQGVSVDKFDGHLFCTNGVISWWQNRGHG